MLGRLDFMQAPTRRSTGRIRRNLRVAACALVPVVGAIAGWVPPVAAATAVSITNQIENGVTGVTARATLAGGDDPTGTVTFQGFGAGDVTCARPPVFTSTNPVTGTGAPKQATSDLFTVTVPGVYRFVATYNGDARNAPAGPTPCDDPNSTLGFGSSHFGFSAQASAPVALGGSVSDTARISSSSHPTGTVSFALFGPDAPTCTGTPVFASSRPVQGEGSYASGPFVPTTPGMYRWVATYSGDADHPQSWTSCADPAQQVEVTAADPSGPSSQCVVRARPLRGLAALLQDLRANPRAVLLSRLDGLTACRAAPPAG